MKISNQKLLYFFSFLMNLVLVYLLYSSFTTSDLERYITSDSLNLPSVYFDIVHYGHSFDGWHFTEAPYFFPDMLVYFLLMKLSNENILVATFLYSLLQLAVFQILIMYLFKVFASKWVFSAPIIVQFAISLALLSMVSHAKHHFLSYLFLHNGYHFSIILMSVLSWIVIFKYFKAHGKALLIILFIIIYLMIISDILFLVGFVFPGIISLFFFQKVEEGALSRRKIFNVLIIILSSAVLSYITKNYSKELMGFVFSGDPYLINSKNWSRSFDTILDTFHSFFVQAGTHWWFMFFMILSFIIVLIHLITNFAVKKVLGKNELFGLIGVVTFIGSVSATIIKGNAYDISSYRYYLPGLLLLFIAFLLIFDQYLKKLVYLFPTITVLLIVYYHSSFSMDVSSYFNYKPRTAIVLDSIARKYSLKHGVAGFWDAKEACMFSEERIRLYPVYETMQPLLHSSNEYWYYGNDDNNGKPIFNFVMTNNFSDLSTLRKLFGEELKQIPEISIYLIPEYRYKRNQMELELLEK